MKRLFLFCIVAVFLTGCSKEYTELPAAKEFLKKDPAAAMAVQAVRGYNRALIISYLHNDVSALKNYATDRELNKVSHMIDGFVSQNLRMEAKLKQMTIEKLERWGPNNVVVTTIEKWSYRRVDTKTNKVVKPQTDIKYHMRYNMLKDNGLWKVFDLSPV